MAVALGVGVLPVSVGRAGTMPYNKSVIVCILLITNTFGYPNTNLHALNSLFTNGQLTDGDTVTAFSSQIAEFHFAETQDGQSSPQTFYPSFPPFQHPPLGHSRPFFFQQEGAYSQRPFGSYDQQQLSYESPRFSNYKDPKYTPAPNTEARGLLGSGNFGVIRGGTFYDKEKESSNYDKDFSSLFNQNGHGRPSYFGGVPNPKAYKHEQFENFRDFADINTPSNPAFSEFVIVYTNRNDTNINTNEDAKKNPENIFDSLTLLDEKNSKRNVLWKKKLKAKEKLAHLKPEKKYFLKKERKSLEQTEPLLALS